MYVLEEPRFLQLCQGAVRWALFVWPVFNWLPFPLFLRPSDLAASLPAFSWPGFFPSVFRLIFLGPREKRKALHLNRPPVTVRVGHRLRPEGSSQCHSQLVGFVGSQTKLRQFRLSSVRNMTHRTGCGSNVCAMLRMSCVFVCL